MCMLQLKQNLSVFDQFRMMCSSNGKCIRSAAMKKTKEVLNEVGLLTPASVASVRSAGFLTTDILEICVSDVCRRTSCSHSFGGTFTYYGSQLVRHLPCKAVCFTCSYLKMTMTGVDFERLV